MWHTINVPIRAPGRVRRRSTPGREHSMKGHNWNRSGADRKKDKLLLFSPGRRVAASLLRWKDRFTEDDAASSTGCRKANLFQPPCNSCIDNRKVVAELNL